MIGVIARGFEGVNGPLRRTRLWIPLAAEATLGTTRVLAGRTPREHRNLVVFGRLANGITETQAAAEIATIGARLDRDFPSGSSAAVARSNERAWSVRSFDTIHRDEANSLRRFGLTVVGLVGLVLAVACTNLANLVLARGTARQGELAVRMAMGASRGRLIWEQCIESLLLAAAGAAASYVMFQVGVGDDDERLRDRPAAGRRDVVDSPGARRPGRRRGHGRHAAGAGGVRSRAGDPAGTHGRHPQRAGGRRHRHPAPRRPAAHGDSLASGHRRRLLHRRDDVHSRHDQPGTPRHRRRARSVCGRDAELRQRRLGRASHPSRDRSRHRRGQPEPGRSRRCRRRPACPSACRR